MRDQPSGSGLLLDPAARRVHPRRVRVTGCLNSVRDEGFVRSGEFERGVYEKRYGVPADPDVVWADRRKEQDQKYGKTT